MNSKTCLAVLAFVACAHAQSIPVPPAVAKSDEAVTLSVFTVTDEKDIGYESMHTTAGMRTVQELKNVANSISIMNTQLIEDTASLNIEEMSKWFVTGEQSPDPAQPNQLIFRGVRNSFALRNGWIWYSPMDSFTTERVEILRGPNAFLYGEADLGGANNLVTKHGLFTRNLTRAKLMIGADDITGNNLRRVELDANRILIRDKLSVRVAAVTSDSEGWATNQERDIRGIYGAITYRPFKKTSISVL